MKLTLKQLTSDVIFDSFLHLDIFLDFQKLSNKELLMKRSKMSHKKSNRVFKKGMGTNRKNVTPAPTRGGYRL